MKKLLSLLLTVILISSLTGCMLSESHAERSDTDNGDGASSQSGDAPSDADGSANNANDVISPNDFLDFIKDYVNVSHYNVSAEDTYCSMGLDLDYQPIYGGNKDIHLLSSPIKIENGTEIYYGMPISGFCAQGWKFDNEANASRELESNNRTLLPVDFVMGNKTLPVLIGNTSENTVTLAEADVHGFDLSYYEASDNCSVRNTDLPDFTMEGSITSNSDLGTIINTLGEPGSVYYSISDSAEKAYGFSRIKLMYKDYGGPTLMIELSNDGKTIFEFDML